MQEGGDGGSDHEGQQGTEEVVEGEEDDPVGDPLPGVRLGVEGAEQGEKVVQGEGEHEEDEQHEGVAFRLALLHDNNLFCLHYQIL